MRRRWRSVGRKARQRIRAGGPLATGRAAASLSEWEQIRDAVLARSRWACQACGTRTGLEVHHVRKRSHGGSDFDLDGLVTLCRPCHEQTDAPYCSGPLMVTPLGAGRFACEVIRRRSKWEKSAPSASIDQPVLNEVARLPVRANTRADRADLRP
jgi:hypothetical protein